MVFDLKKEIETFKKFKKKHSKKKRFRELEFKVNPESQYVTIKKNSDGNLVTMQIKFNEFDKFIKQYGGIKNDNI